MGGLKILHTANPVFSAEAVLAGANASSDIIELSEFDGFASLQWLITGDGTAKFEVLSSNDGSNFLDVNDDIITGQTKTSGPGSDGKNMCVFTLMPSRSCKIKVTETGGAQAIAVTAYLYIH